MVEAHRTRFVHEIEARRRAIERYLDIKRPVSNRLTTISVISSCVAAALAAAPAVGGKGCADAVGNGLAIGQSETVWRLLCFAAVAASIAAAISANLSKSSDLAERIAAAEAANSLLDGIRARMLFSRLPVADAAQQYQEVIVRIPWVPDPDDGAPGATGDEDGPPDRRGWSRDRAGTGPVPVGNHRRRCDVRRDGGGRARRRTGTRRTRRCAPHTIAGCGPHRAHPGCSSRATGRARRSSGVLGSH